MIFIDLCLQQHFIRSRGIFYLEVREVCSLWAHIYIFVHIFLNTILPNMNNLKICLFGTLMTKIFTLLISWLNAILFTFGRLFFNSDGSENLLAFFLLLMLLSAEIEKKSSSKNTKIV